MVDGEALASCEEAIAIRRRLAAGHPRAFRGSLPAALDQVADHLLAAGRSEEAFAARYEAAGLRQDLGPEPPGA